MKKIISGMQRGSTAWRDSLDRTLVQGYGLEIAPSRMKYWFTADTHLGHGAIIRFCGRPFQSVEEMDEVLVRNWNSVVSPDDTIYHLGDFALGNLQRLRSYRERLRGRIILIRGNHDRRSEAFDSLFDEVHDLHEITTSWRSKPLRIVLCHYALRVWSGSHYGAWHLYGHSHGKLPDDPQALSLDVGVDCWSYRPISLDDIGLTIEKKESFSLTVKAQNDEY